MLKFSVKTISAIIFWGIFIFVIFQIPYPNSLIQANMIQMLSFFFPLFFALIFTINIFLNFLIRSILVSSALIVFLILQALQSLNLLTFILTSVAFGLFISYFKKKTHLTSNLKIRKLTHK